MCLLLEILATLQRFGRFCHIFTTHAQKRLFVHSLSKFWHRHWIQRPRFPITHGYFCDRWSFAIYIKFVTSSISRYSSILEYSIRYSIEYSGSKSSIRTTLAGSMSVVYVVRSGERSAWGAAHWRDLQASSLRQVREAGATWDRRAQRRVRHLAAANHWRCAFHTDCHR